ncbi:MAG: rhodanese-like domain-containing protein [Pyrinomonadaceae bacterium]
MRKISALVALTLFTFVFACAGPQASATVVSEPTPQQPAATPQDDAQRISLADAKKGFDDKTAIFFDARTVDAYKEGHVKGAINIGYDNWEKMLKGVLKDKTIIVYCS